MFSGNSTVHPHPIFSLSNIQDKPKQDLELDLAGLNWFSGKVFDSNEQIPVQLAIPQYNITD